MVVSMGDEADRIIDDGIRSMAELEEYFEMDYRPRNNTLRNVVNYLESIGLEIMGPCVDLETGIRFAAHRNFNAEQTVQYRKLYEQLDGDFEECHG